MSSGQKEWYLEEQAEKLRRSDAYQSGVAAERARCLRVVAMVRPSDRIDMDAIASLIRSGEEPRR